MNNNRRIKKVQVFFVLRSVNKAEIMLNSYTMGQPFSFDLSKKLQM